MALSITKVMSSILVNNDLAYFLANWPFLGATTAYSPSLEYCLPLIYSKNTHWKDVKREPGCVCAKFLMNYFFSYFLNNVWGDIGIQNNLKKNYLEYFLIKFKKKNCYKISILQWSSTL